MRGEEREGEELQQQQQQACLGEMCTLLFWAAVALLCTCRARGLRGRRCRRFATVDPRHP